MNFKLFSAVAVILFAACDMNPDANDSIQKDAIAFSEKYFNFDFRSALDYSTPESRKWISYVASNVSDEDLGILRSYGHAAVVDANGIDIIGDTTAVVTMSVSGFLSTDSIGRPGHIVEKAVFRLPMVCRKGRWLVRMEGPLRSER